MAAKLINNSNTAFQHFPRERYSSSPIPMLSLSLIICVYSLYHAYLISFEIRCSDRGRNLVFFSNVLNRWGLELHSYEKMSPHKRLFKQKSQSLFDDCHTPFDLLFISAFVRLFTESFAKSKVLLRKPTACSSLGIPVKIFGLTGATAGLLGWFFFFWWYDSDPGRKKKQYFGG